MAAQGPSARGSSRKIPTSLPGRSTRQTVSTRVHSLSTRSREPFRTSLDLTDTYGTPGDMSILFLLGRRHSANHAMFEASALHRATMPSHAPPTDPCRVRGVGMDPCPKHAQPLRRARARAAGRSLASASPQRMAAGPADRISDLHAQHLAALKGTRCGTSSVCSAPASSRRCRRQLSSSRPGQVLQVAQRCGTR